MKFLGLHMEEQESVILLQNNSYAKSIEEIDIPTSGDKSRELNDNEKSKVRHTAGQLNWLSSQTRPDIAFENCVVGSSVSKATVETVYKVNKAIRKVKQQDTVLRFPKALDIEHCQILTFCDASFANLTNRASQGGHILFLVDPKGTYCPISWQSHRLKRVVSSTLAAECLASVEAAEHCTWLQATVSEILGFPPPVSLFSDSKSLVEAAHSSTTVQNKRLQIELSVLRDTIIRGELNEFRWISSDKNLANPLTKVGASTELLLNVLCSDMKYDFNSASFVRS